MMPKKEFKAVITHQKYIDHKVIGMNAAKALLTKMHSDKRIVSVKLSRATEKLPKKFWKP